MTVSLRHVAAVLALGLAGAPAGAASPTEDYTLGASITGGYRSVDVDGSKAKYREDYNLPSGFRLFNFDVSGTANDPAKSSLDHFHLLIDTPGNEPVSTYLLDAGDRQHWDFRANFTRSKYFYDVPQLFEGPVTGDDRTNDLHSFDQVRTNGAVDFTVWLPRMPKLFVGYRLYQEEGDDMMSTVNIPASDTFLVRAPLDSRMHVGLAGTEFDALGTNFFLEQQYRRTSRNLGDHGPFEGDVQGLDPTDASTLTSYNAAGSEHVEEPVTTVKLRRPIGDRIEVAGDYLYAHADLSSHWTTSQDATTNVPTVSGVSHEVQDGHSTLDTNIADLGATLHITEQLSAHAAYRFDEQWQRGEFDQQGTTVLSTNTGDHLSLQRLTGDFAWDPRRDLTLRAGLRYAWRLANFSLSGVGPITTQTLGAIADARWHPSSKLSLFAGYENAQIDDPYLVEGDQLRQPPIPSRQITLTFRNRGQAGGMLRPRDWITLSYRFIADSRENSSFAASSTAYGNSGSITLTPLSGLTVLAAYTRRDLDDQANILFAPTYVPTRATQAGSEDVLTSQITYDFGLFGQRWSTGGHVFYVNSDQHWSPRFEASPGDVMLFELSRVDAGAFLTYRHPWIEPSLEFRIIHYNERVLPQNDYRATIISATLTKRFGSAAAP
jgi:hypothetical protein